MKKKFFKWISNIIEHRKGIRRFIVLTAFPLWLFLSLVFGLGWLKGYPFSSGFATWYATFTSVISVIVGFYFWTRGRDGNHE